MKKAVQLPQYSDTNDFTPPDGVQLDQSSTRSPTCWPMKPAPTTYTAAFLDGTAPTDTCDHKGPNGEDHRNIFQKIFGLGKPPN